MFEAATVDGETEFDRQVDRLVEKNVGLNVAALGQMAMGSSGHPDVVAARLLLGLDPDKEPSVRSVEGHTKKGTAAVLSLWEQVEERSARHRPRKPR